MGDAAFVCKHFVIMTGMELLTLSAGMPASRPICLASKFSNAFTYVMILSNTGIGERALSQVQPINAPLFF